MKNKPAYMQLYEELRDEITSGTLSYGTKLPSKRSEKENTGLSLVTIEHAYALLVEEGYIETKERRGYYVSYRDSDLFSYAGQDHVNTAKLIIEDDTFPYNILARTMRKVLSERQEEILAKTDGTGALDLRTAIAMYLARNRNMSVEPDQIVIGAGAEYLYSLIVQLFGRNIVYGIENPGYEKIKEMYQANDVCLDELKMGRNGIISSELKRTDARALHVTPFHSFPTGTTADASKRREYIDWAKNRNAVIIEDDYESEFSRNGRVEQTLFHLEPDDHVIYMNTFTKTIAPSIRVGYMVLPKNKTAEYLKKISNRSCTVSAFEQYVITELLNNGSFERNINRIRRKRRESEK